MSKWNKPDLKLKIVQEYANGVSVKALTSKYLISKSSIYNWIVRYKDIAHYPNIGYRIKRVHDLEEHIKKLNEEIHILQEISFFGDYSNVEKTKLIDSLRGKYSIQILCKAVNIRKSIYYHHHNKPKTHVEKQEEILKHIVNELYYYHRRAVGSKKLRLYMKRKGIDISKKRVQRLMRELNISKLRTNKPKFHHQHLNTQSCLNLINRNFNTPAPNQVWVSDIKYVYVGKRFMYLCVIIDLFSRKVISFKISNRMTKEIVIDAFKNAFKLRNNPKNLIFHSDLGSQYTSTAFRELLKQLNVRQSFSAPASPYDNAVAESFFATYKRECLDLELPFNYVRKFKTITSDFIKWYNLERIHQSLDYLTPLEKEEQFDKDYPFSKKLEISSFKSTT